ncbi:MAG: MBL fold metallo-hydrolase [Phycisphaerae bacterium]|nr:MBL fold metallo-hydrolase [Phycisphaerae bacterium]
MSSVKVTILGSGTSHGVPMIGCDCPVCTSPDPRDKRTRSSILIETAGQSILVDTTPELRVQCLTCNVRRVDAVLYTHAHADHVTGMDDLRRFNHLQSGPITCYADAHTGAILKRMFSYAFNHDPNYVSAIPQLNLAPIDGPLELNGVRIIPIRLFHGELPVLGFRVGRFAYCTDVSRIPDESFELLRGLEVLVLDALRRRPHPTHFNLEQAVETAGRIAADQTYFTHIAHELGHEATNVELPRNMALGYDGQVIDSIGD